MSFQTLSHSSSTSFKTTCSCFVCMVGIEFEFKGTFPVEEEADPLISANKGVKKNAIKRTK